MPVVLIYVLLSNFWTVHIIGSLLDQQSWLQGLLGPDPKRTCCLGAIVYWSCFTR